MASTRAGHRRDAIDATYAGWSSRSSSQDDGVLKDFKENHTDTSSRSHPAHEPNCRGSSATAESRPSRHRRDVGATAWRWVSHWLICSQVSFTVTALSGAKLDEAEKAPGGLLKKFKLESSMATSNMNFFDSGGVAIERYATPFDICKAFYKGGVARLRDALRRSARLIW